MSPGVYFLYRSTQFIPVFSSSFSDSSSVLHGAGVYLVTL